MPAPGPKVSEMRYPSQTVMGYSASHSQHANQTSAWSNRAYKGLTASQIGTVKINLYVYEPTCNAKGQPIIVHVSSKDYLVFLNHFNPYTGHQGRATR
jgi:hypothetical protein